MLQALPQTLTGQLSVPFLFNLAYSIGTSVTELQRSSRWKGFSWGIKL